jgi:hypothetical protein
MSKKNQKDDSTFLRTLPLKRITFRQRFQCAKLILGLYEEFQGVILTNGYCFQLHQKSYHEV